MFITSQFRKQTQKQNIVAYERPDMSCMIFDILPYNGGQITDERAFTLRYWLQIIVGPLKKACFALNSDWDCACKKISLYPMQRSFKMCIFNV